MYGGIEVLSSSLPPTGVSYNRDGDIVARTTLAFQRIGGVLRETTVEEENVRKSTRIILCDY